MAFRGFHRKLIGAKADDAKIILTPSTEDEKDDALRGKEVLFTIVVES